MMSPIQQTLSNPTIKINNEIVTIKPNSFSFDVGKGEKKVSGVSVGAGATGVAISDDVSTRIGKMKMSFFTTPENVARFRQWKSATISEGNTITASEENFTLIGKYMQIINSPDIMIGTDESFEVEFHGLPLESN